ncbi:MAG: hypothetical protein LBI31_04185, partial [Zoogloeaceae bacterium]|nr:hypothetical protein [Zoogloeaceae bacterium]
MDIRHFFRSAIARSPLRWVSRLSRFKRLFLWAGAVFVLLFFAFVIYLRFWFMPDLPRYLPEIEAAASEALGQPVSIGSMEARLDFRPFVLLRDIRVFSGNAKNPDAPPEEVSIRVESIEGSLSWRSLFGQAVFASLTLNQPELTLLRMSGGQWRVAGISPSGESGDDPLEWLFLQRQIRVVDARFHVRDEWAKAPDFSLTAVALDWKNRGARHRFDLTAHATDAEGKMVAKIDASGDLEGEAGTPIADWEGNLGLQWQADALAPWRRWMVASEHMGLPPGMFFDMTKSEAEIGLRREQAGWRATADMSLYGVRLRLGESLPELKLKKAGGHLSLSRNADGKWQVGSKDLQLVEEDGKTSAPLDLAASWQEVTGTPDTPEASIAPDTPRDEAARDDMPEVTGDSLPRQVDFTANRLDLSYLARLAAYFPLPDEARENLRRHNPQGVLEKVRFGWDAGESRLRYTLEADFSRLGLTAAGTIPGASGLSGHVRANERGGQLALDSRALSISLPTVFDEPSFPLARLQANVDWQKKADADGVDVEIRQFDFSGPHVAGKVRGRYESRPDEAGFIDLNGNFTQAKATDVWRYIPRKIGKETRSWLHNSLTAGTAEAQLVLRGNLNRFPFHEGEDEGVFRITVQVRDAAVRYHPKWPEITEISGDLEFGAGMLIRAREGRIFSTRISDGTTVTIPVLLATGNRVQVEGEVTGETADFLRFIKESPVAASINHFTSGITSEGEGKLELKLDLPLADLDASGVEGTYYLLDNRIDFMADLPPARSVRGTLAFTRNDVRSDGLAGDFLGKPFRLTARSQKGEVLIQAEGGLEGAALKQELAGRMNLPKALL